MALRFRNLGGNPYTGLMSAGAQAFGRAGQAYMDYGQARFRRNMLDAQEAQRQREREDARYNSMIDTAIKGVGMAMQFDMKQDELQYNKNLQKFKLEDEGFSAQLKSLKPGAMQKVLDARTKAINNLGSGEDFEITEGGLFGVKLDKSDYRPTNTFKTQKESLDVWEKLRKANESSYEQGEKAWRKEFGIAFNEEFGGEQIPSREQLEVMRKEGTLPKGIKAFENKEGEFEFTTIPDKNEWIEQNYQGVTSNFPTYDEWIGGGGRSTGYSGGAVSGEGNRSQILNEIKGQVKPELLGVQGSKGEERSTVGKTEQLLAQALEGKDGQDRQSTFDFIVDSMIEKGSEAYNYLAEKFMGGDQQATASPTTQSIPQDTGMRQDEKEVSEGLQTSGPFQGANRSTRQEREEQQSVNEYFGTVRKLETVDPDFSRKIQGSKKGEAFAFTVAPDGKMDQVHMNEAGLFIEDKYLSKYRKKSSEGDEVANISTADLIKARDEFRSDALLYHMDSVGEGKLDNDLMAEINKKADESTDQFMSMLSSLERADKFQGISQQNTEIMDQSAPVINDEGSLVAENIRRTQATSGLTFNEPDLISKGEANVERPEETEPLDQSGTAKDIFVRALGGREPRFYTRLYKDRETGKEMIRITEEVTGNSLAREYDPDSPTREQDRINLQIELGSAIFNEYKDNPLPFVTEGEAPKPKTRLERTLPDNIDSESIALNPERPNVSNEMASLQSSLNRDVLIPPTVNLNQSDKKSLISQSGGKNATAFAEEKKYDGQATAPVITDDPVDNVNQQRLNFNPYEVPESPSTSKKSIAGSALNPKLESEEDIFVKAVQVSTDLNEQQEVSYGGETYNVEIPPEALVLFVDMEAKRVVDGGKNKFHVNFQKMDGDTPSFGIGQMKEGTLKDINEARVLNGETPITPEDMKTDAKSQLEATASYLKYIIYPECESKMGDKWQKLSPSERLELAYLRYNGGVTWKPNSEDGWEHRSKQAEKNHDRIKRLIDDRNLRAELDAGFTEPSIFSNIVDTASDAYDSVYNYFQGGAGQVQAGAR